jgi:hypothetical protein
LNWFEAPWISSGIGRVSSSWRIPEIHCTAWRSFSPFGWIVAIILLLINYIKNL